MMNEHPMFNLRQYGSVYCDADTLIMIRQAIYSKYCDTADESYYDLYMAISAALYDRGF